MATERIAHTPTEELRRFKQRRFSLPGWLIPLLTVALVFLSLYVVTHRQLSQGETVLIAILCDGAIAASLMPKRKHQTTDRIYLVRGPFGLVMRFKGDTETDQNYAAHWEKYDKGE